MNMPYTPKSKTEKKILSMLASFSFLYPDDVRKMTAYERQVLRKLVAAGIVQKYDYEETVYELTAYFYGSPYTRIIGLTQL
jgi:hypothetical protein